MSAWENTMESCREGKGRQLVGFGSDAEMHPLCAEISRSSIKPLCSTASDRQSAPSRPSAESLEGGWGDIDLWRGRIGVAEQGFENKGKGGPV